MALHHFGPSFRYPTVLVPDGEIDPLTRTLKGDLHVHAGGDPDFHFENALLVAAQLNQMGIARVAGNLLIHGEFHMGWNNGAVPANQDEWRDYVVRKGRLLLGAWNVQKWSPLTWQGWKKIRPRLSATDSGWAEAEFSGISLDGHIRATTADAEPKPSLFVIHYSNPLLRILKRFDSYSNNDIERIGQQLGGPRALETFLVETLGQSANEVEFSSTSGLGKNRLSPRAAVQVVRNLITFGQEHGFELSDILPVAGIDEGTLSDRFADPGCAGSVVAKTGQLVSTDGGVQALSGMSYTRESPLLFAIFHLRTGSRIQSAHVRMDQALLYLVNRMGGPAPLKYQPTSFPLCYDQVQIEVAAGERLPRNFQRFADRLP
jgi:D-alanyl-D-alanine carboxypeptidase/D-alanyl-D-alanine-endopeptidase (penicillin-binding protein 4)